MGTASRLAAVGSLFAAALLLASCGAGAPAPAHGTNANPPTTSGANVTGANLSPPAVPDGAYLGAWVNPAKAQASPPGAQELAQLPAFTQQVGHPMGILSVYAGFHQKAPIATLDAIAGQGAVPMISWGCAPPDQIAAGRFDALITAYAEALRAFGHPLFLRWYWEMNLTTLHPRCQSAGGAADFVAAWRRMHTLFVQAKATNVAFVWCPSIAGGLAGIPRYFPGDSYIDWIGIDGYQHQTTPDATFAALFTDWYGEWSVWGKPLMIGETGAQPPVQRQYLDSVKAVLPTQFRAVRAFVYFDSPGPHGQWELDGDGLAGMADLATDPYFATGS